MKYLRVELQDLYFLLEVLGWSGRGGWDKQGMWNTQEEKCIKGLVMSTWKKEKRPLGRTTRRWERVIKMDLRGIEWECVESTHLAQGRDSLLLQRGSNQFSITKFAIFLD